MRTFFSALLFLIVCANLSGQDLTEFTNTDSHYINGDGILIGNNILSAHPTKPYKDFNLLNDQIKMRYVDIDNDRNTFCSSSASLKLPSRDAKIIKATLYWTAVYPFKTGTRKQRSNEIIYYGAGKREPDFDQVLFKTPGGDYQEVQGQIIFDGIQYESYTDSAPYIAYAEVTELLNNSQAAEGDYTVANIRATEGFVSGGASAGWFLFIVYEDPDASPKYINTYHGFANINDRAVELKFSDFQTKETGEVSASVFIATLEGDGKLYRDQCEVQKGADTSYVLLKNKARPERNFFNSKITSGERYVSERNPNSTNTLGFDLLKTDVPGEALVNDQTEFKLRFSTKADRYYVFFTAFSVEINEIFQLEKEALNQEVLAAESKELTEQNISEQKQDPEKQLTRAEITKENPRQKPEQTRTKKPRVVTGRFSGMEPGYYIITNVFSKPSYAKRWSDFLKSEGYTPEIFVNPKNNWHYVYTSTYEQRDEAYKSFQKLVKLDNFKEIWIYKINID